jgi:SAM-dependent methyltransferase
MGSPATTCAWCGAPLGDDAERLRGRARCSACGAATTDPWPSEEDLEAAYGTWYRPDAGNRFAFGLGDAVLGRTRGLLASRLDAIAPEGPVIDVGAGDGTLLDALHRRGREGIGLERNSARDDFRDEPLEEVDGDGTWAAVVLWHSLEHLPRPGAAVREAARLLRPGGVIAIAVPNNGSLQARAFGDEWLHLDLPRHLVHLSAKSLTRGLERAGFTVERTSYARAGQTVIGWLDGLVGKLPGGLDLYQSLRRPEAQSERISPLKRALAVGSAVLLLPVAAGCAAVELAVRRGGTVYVEGRLG